VSRPATLYFGLLGAPVAWTAHFFASYLLVTLACTGRLPAPRLWLAVATVAAAAVAAAAGAVAVRAARADGDAAGARRRFLGATGGWLAALFLLAIVLGAAPAFLMTAWCG
jgi:hypothetical protein